MEQQQLLKQMMQLNKTSFDNSFNAMTQVYEQNKKLAESFLSQTSWMPEEGRKAYNDWMAAIQSGAADFKKMMDENYGKVAAYFEGK